MEFNYQVIKAFESSRCKVTIYESPFVIEDEKVFVVISINKFTGKRLVRFGNLVQVLDIEKTYSNRKYLRGNFDEDFRL